MKLQLHILTPEKEVYNQEVDEVMIPTTDGVIGVLAEHTPLVSQIAPGELLIKTAGKTEPMAVFGGFVQVGKNTVSILADYASHVDDIELAVVEQAKERAEKLMQEKLSEQDYIAAEAELQKALMQLRIVRKYRHRN